MESIPAAVADLWWVVPALGGAGAAVVATIRTRDAMTGRRLGVEAARIELRRAQTEARAAASAVALARAEVSRLAAERAASRVDAGAVAAARRTLVDAQRQAKAASAAVKAGRARLDAERAALRSGAGSPLDRVNARHDAVLARWLEYETDAVTQAEVPQMSDGRHPATAAFLSAMQRARDLRPSSARPAAAEFGAYRTAVEELERAFDVAEREARGEQSARELPDALKDAARALIARSAEALEHATDALGDWNAKRRRER